MKPVFQKVISNKNGDCYPACLASILEIPLDQIPPFHMEEDDFEYWEKCKSWLATLGYAISSNNRDIEGRSSFNHWFLEGCHCILSVPSQKFGGSPHSVVGRYEKQKNGAIVPKIVHDPNPNNEPYPEDFKFYSVDFIVKI